MTSDTVDSKHDKNAVKQDDRYAVKLDDDMTSETVASKDDKNSFKQDNDMTSDTVDSKDKSDSSARQMTEMLLNKMMNMNQTMGLIR